MNANVRARGRGPIRRAAPAVVLIPLVVAVWVVAAAADDGGSLGRWPYGPCLAASVEDRVVYFSSGSAVILAEIADDGVPVVLSEIVLPGVVRDLEADNGYIYVADHLLGLLVYDIGDPSDPTRLSVTGTAGSAAGVHHAGSIAYVAGNESGIVVYDVSSPSAPIEVGCHSTRGVARGIVIEDGLAYLADGWAGLAVFDVGAPQGPARVAEIAMPLRSTSGSVCGGYAFLRESRHGVEMVRDCDRRRFD